MIRPGIVALASLGALGLAAAPPVTSPPAPAVSIGSIVYEGEYTASQTVKLYRGTTANIAVFGPNLYLARAVEVVTPSGAPAPGITATMPVRGPERVTITVVSQSGAALGDYSIRVRYPYEPQGPDAFKVRLYQRGTVGSIAIEGGSATNLTVGQAYTLVATGTDLDRLACCSGTGVDRDVVSVEPLSRTSTSARFRLVMKRGEGTMFLASNFYDGALPSAPNPCNIQCYRGNAQLSVAGVVVPSVAGMSPDVATPGTSATITGSNLAPGGWRATVWFARKYGGGVEQRSASGSSASLAFTVPSNVRSDSIRMQYESSGTTRETMGTNQVFPLPGMFVAEPPVVAGTGTIVRAMKTTMQYDNVFAIRPGSMMVLGKHLLSPPTPTTITSVRSATTTTSITRALSSGPIVPLGSPIPPTVAFGSTALQVQSAAYMPNGFQPTPSGTSGERGVDRVAVTVPDLGPNAVGTLTVSTTQGSATLSNVVYANAPRVTAVEELENPAGSGLSNRTLYKGVTYRFVGSNLAAPANAGFVREPMVKLNGAIIGSGLVAARPIASLALDGTSFRLTIPNDAASGPLVIDAFGGSVDLGTFTAASRPIAPQLSGLVLSPSPVVGGASTTATVAFAGQIPTDGSAGSVVLTTPTADQTVVPSILSIPITANPLTFQVATRPVTAPRTVQVTVKLSSSNVLSSQQVASLVVNPPKPTALTLAAATVTGGQQVAGTVRIDASLPSSLGVTVALSSSDPSTVSVPATATVGGTTANFTATTTAVTSPRQVTITAAIAGVTQTATLTVQPPALSTIALAQTRVLSGRATTGSITFTAPVSAAPVQYASSDPTVVVTAFPTASGTTQTFNVATKAVAAQKTVSITATAGEVSKSVSLTLDPLLLQSVSVGSASVAAGQTSPVTVRLSAPAPEKVDVELSSNNPAVTFSPARVSLIAGQDVELSALTTSAVAAPTQVTITAKLLRVVPPATQPAATTTATATITVTP